MTRTAPSTVTARPTPRLMITMAGPQAVWTAVEDPTAHRGRRS
ncbi:MAG: hypothetical protein ACQEXM_29115 [Actinomycetota bacterium]|jgi:hypothetical protein|nr:hypothetical protein [Pseudonocardia alni]